MRKPIVKTLLSILLVAVVLVGGTLAYLMASDSPVLNTFKLAEVKTDIDHLNTVDLSFAMGLSYDFNMGLVVSARYNLGLTNVIEKDKFGGNNQNRVFQLSAGWKF